MENQNQNFIYRLTQLPVIKAASDKAISIYVSTKNSNRLFNTTLQLAENSFNYVNQIDAVKKVKDNQLTASITSIANKIGVDQLDKVERNYPAVRKTPDQLWKVGQDYYNRSLVKKNVDNIYAVKNYSVKKVSDTKNYYQSLLTGGLDNLLNYTDSLVDKYFTVQHDSNGQPPNCDAKSSYYIRVRCISGKFYYGIKHRANQTINETTELTLKKLNDYRVTAYLLEQAKLTTNWANHKLQATLITIQEQKKAISQDIQRRKDVLANESEAIALTTVKRSSTFIAALSQQFIKYSSPYLPEGVEKPIAAGTAYIVDLRDSFAKAKTLGDVRNRVVDDAKKNYGYLQVELNKGIDYLVDFPPISWLIPDRYKSTRLKSSKKIENGYVGGENKHGGH